MNIDTLKAAVEAGQLIKLMTPLGALHKGTSLTLSRIRSQLESQVACAALFPGEAQGKTAGGYIFILQDELRRAVVTNFDVESLVTANWNPSGSILTSGGQIGRRSTAGRRPLGIHLARYFKEAMEPVLGIGVPPNFSKTDSRAVGNVVKTFSSIVRNSSWLAVLAALKVELSSMEDANSRLLELYGSRPGQAKVLANMASLITQGEVIPQVPRARKSKSVEADIRYELSLWIPAETLLRHPTIAAGLAGSPALSRKSEFTKLLAEASAPVNLAQGRAPDTAAAERMNAFLEGFSQLQKEQDKAEAAAKKRVLEANKEKAVEALRGMGPLLEILKANPSLLEKA